MLKNVRVFYKKKSRMKFVSHLDMNRFMIRAIRRTKIPVWYTEGFNCHAYVTFALPLSLGFQSEYEIMDFKVTDDNYSLENVKSELAGVMPEYIEIFAVAEPILKAGKIAFAEFKVYFEDIADSVKNDISAYLSADQIVTTKRTKKGAEKVVDLKPQIKSFEFEGDTLILTLSAGNDNLNPTLLLSAFEANNYELPDYTITRTKILDEQLNIFK
ncbi:MAG: TIGR03936 family radical SAM-associated protein [Acutalibacteraceae bacterium]|nr:TIGR03936 family radical SAM-associated protein [Acutalibacteraceae bacterium]